MRKVYVGGSFDCFHEGHKELLRDALRIVGTEGKIIVVVNNSDFFKAYKGFSPKDEEITRYFNVKKYVASLTHNFEVHMTDFSGQRSKLSIVNPDFILHGTDWTGEALAKNFGVTMDWLAERGILLVYTDRRTGKSSTEERKKRK